MSTMDEMLKVANKAFDINFSFYVFNHFWRKEDFRDLTKYETLSMAALLYILSGKEKRSLITSALENNLEIENAESAVKYLILHDLNSVSAAKLLFRRIPYASGLVQNSSVAKDVIDSVYNIFLSVSEIYLLSTLAVSPDEMHLNLASLTLRMWVDCQANNLRNANKECEPFHDFMEWPSLDEFISIIHENKLRFDPYEPMGDALLDAIGRPICEYFLDWVTDGFVMFARDSIYPEFYFPYRESDYAEALGRYRFITDYSAKYGTYTDEFKTAAVPIKKIVDKILAIADELEPSVQNIDGSDPPFTLRTAARLSLLKFFLYLTASDEYISGKEVRAIRECLGYHLSKDDVKELIRKQNIYTVTFENETPPIMDLLMQADRALAAKGYVGNISYTKQYVDLCEKAGYLFIACDGSMNEDEERDLKTIIEKYNRLAKRIEREIRK